MNDPVFLSEQLVMAIHHEQLAQHGGASGVRDVGLLQSALARAENKMAYGSPSPAEMAAAYAYGIARNHPFVDGNKRTAFVAAQVFLRLNGKRMNIDHVEATLTFLRLAAGDISEDDLAAWVARHVGPYPA
jgi:death-on-curing protein